MVHNVCGSYTVGLNLRLLVGWLDRTVGALVVLSIDSTNCNTTSNSIGTCFECSSLFYRYSKQDSISL